MRKPLNVLVVEDEPTTIDLYLAIMQANGHEVAVAEDGMRAVKMALDADPAFDVIVMDVAMPGLDGFEATAALRGHPKTARMPILVCSARAAQIDRERGRQAGCDHFLPKPFRWPELIQAIDIAIAASGGRPPEG